MNNTNRRLTRLEDNAQRRRKKRAKWEVWTVTPDDDTAIGPGGQVLTIAEFDALPQDDDHNRIVLRYVS